MASSCLFAPNIADAGYVPCASDGDCDPGRTCGEGVCAPPPWNDEEFGQRRLLTVQNPSEQPMPKGTAVPVVVGGDAGLLALDDVGPDFRVSDFDVDSGKWHVVSVFLDRESDRFTAWIPTQREVKQGRTEVLAWLESDTFAKVATVVEDPVTTFADYDSFDGDAVDESKWHVNGTPHVADGSVNIADNQSIALERALVPPVLMTAIARVNGINCSEVFVGLIGDVNSRFNVGPSAGLFIGDQLAASAQVAPDEASVPTPLGDALTASTSFARITVAVDGAGVVVKVDDTVAYSETDLRPPFGDAPMFAAVQVGGACSVDVDAVWTTPLPLPSPSVTPSDAVHFQLFQ